MKHILIDVADDFDATAPEIEETLIAAQLGEVIQVSIDPADVQAQADADVAEQLQRREQAAEEEWAEICNQQDWDEVTQVIHLEGFIRDRTLFAEFAQYARQCAGEENEEKAYAAKIGLTLEQERQELEHVPA